MDFLSGLIGAGAKIFGGILGQNSQEQITQQNIAEQNYLASNRIQLTVDDAKKAGINPLAALGNATQTWSNVAGSTALGDSIGSAGQDIGRAVAAMAPVKLRNAELENKLLEAKIRNFDSDTVSNMKDNSDIATKLGQPGTPPAYPPVNLPGGVIQHVSWGDPRGPVRPLENRFLDRDGTIVNLPSDKAASPLQTLYALPTNALGAVRGANDYLEGVYGQAARAVQDFNASIYDRNTTGY